MPSAHTIKAKFLCTLVVINRNQQTDPAPDEETAKGFTFEASRLRGFALDIDGPLVPSFKDLQFSVLPRSSYFTDNFCSPARIKLHAGSNAALFSDLVEGCVMPNDDAPTAESEQSKPGQDHVARAHEHYVRRSVRVLRDLELVHR